MCVGEGSGGVTTERELERRKDTYVKTGIVCGKEEEYVIKARKKISTEKSNYCMFFLLNKNEAIQIMKQNIRNNEKEMHLINSLPGNLLLCFLSKQINLK